MVGRLYILRQRPHIYSWRPINDCIQNSKKQLLDSYWFNHLFYKEDHIKTRKIEGIFIRWMVDFPEHSYVQSLRKYVCTRIILEPLTKEA